MRLTVAAIGRLRGGPEQALVDDYANRIRAGGRALGISAFELREMEAPKGLSGDKRRERESALLIESTGAGAKRVILDERGDNLSSDSIAGKIMRWRDDGAPEIAFMIGGADGHAKALLEKADLKLAFGRATFPHMLVRVMLVEQIYRATTIIAGHPYHRA